jgi:hypothetical protein
MSHIRRRPALKLKPIWQWNQTPLWTLNPPVTGVTALDPLAGGEGLYEAEFDMEWTRAIENTHKFEAPQHMPTTTVTDEVLLGVLLWLDESTADKPREITKKRPRTLRMGRRRQTGPSIRATATDSQDAHNTRQRVNDKGKVEAPQA